MYVKMTVTHTSGKNLLSTNQRNIIFQSLMTLTRKNRESLSIKCGFLASSEVRDKEVSDMCMVYECLCMCVVCVWILSECVCVCVV